MPAANKSLSLCRTSDDPHGNTALQAIHGVCAGSGARAHTPAIGHYAVDAYDWGFCWRSFDALRAWALYGTDCRYALGDAGRTATSARGVTVSVSIIALKIRTRTLADPPASQSRAANRTRVRTLSHSATRPAGENASGRLAPDPDPAARHRIGRERDRVRRGRDRAPRRRALHSDDGNGRIRRASRLRSTERIRRRGRREPPVAQAAEAVAARVISRPCAGD